MEWGLRPWFESDDILDEVFISIASLVNTNAAMHNRIDVWLVRYMQCSGRAENAASVRVYWQCLNVTKSLLDLFCEVDPVWCPRRRVLIVSERLLDDPKGWEKASAVILECRKWRKWSLTRWGKVCRAGQMWVRGCATGVEAAVQQCFEDHTCSDTNLAGFLRASPAVRKLLAIASFAACPFDDFIVDLLDDDAFLRRAEGLKLKLWGQLEHILGLPMLVWDRVATTVDSECPGVALRSEALYPMMITYGFFWRETYLELDSYPWSLTQGSLRDNVEALAGAREKVADPMTERMRLFANVFGAASLEEGLELLRDAPCSTALTEQGHAPSKLHLKNTRLQLRNSCECELC